jgi:hypothetical protein
MASHLAGLVPRRKPAKPGCPNPGQSFGLRYGVKWRRLDMSASARALERIPKV